MVSASKDISETKNHSELYQSERYGHTYETTIRNEVVHSIIEGFKKSVIGHINYEPENYPIKPETSNSEYASQKSIFSYDFLIPLLTTPKDSALGELALPCFQIAKVLKKSPVEIAKILSDNISPIMEVSEITAVGPYVNFKYNRQTQIKAITERVLKNEHKNSIIRLVKKIVLEYSSPNVAKTFHVGHLRNTILGGCIEKLLRLTGAEVITINHLGDYGTQFGYVYAGIKKRPELKNDTSSIDDLVEAYKFANQLKEASQSEISEVELIAKDYFKALENREPYALEFLEWCTKLSHQYFELTYSRLGIKFDYTLGESFYADKISAVKKRLEDSHLLVESQGALGIDLGEKLGFARFFAPDGRSLYFTRDLAAIYYRHERFQFDEMYYVVAAQQSLHFEQLFETCKKLQAPFAHNVHHLQYGWVLGMSTRKGKGVGLQELIEEAEEKAQSTYLQSARPDGANQEEIIEAVSLAAIVFSILHRSRMKDVNFDLDQALRFQGDTGPYLLYTYARLSSVERKAEGILPATEIIHSQVEGVFQILRVIDRFGETVNRTIQEFDPVILTTYALELAGTTSKYYDELRVVGSSPEIASERLLLFTLAKTTLGEVIDLLGMKKIEKM